MGYFMRRKSLTLKDYYRDLGITQVEKNKLINQELANLFSKTKK